MHNNCCYRPPTYRTYRHYAGIKRIAHSVETRLRCSKELAVDDDDDDSGLCAGLPMMYRRSHIERWCLHSQVRGIDASGCTVRFTQLPTSFPVTDARMWLRRLYGQSGTSPTIVLLCDYDGQFVRWECESCPNSKVLFIPIPVLVPIDHVYFPFFLLGYSS